ncbi:MAG: alpha-ketoglutarate-dependent taurine dioxygenase [Granulosicoccus sp.]|jgi:alpha-ketoglutarate-dependent taurine dioxygenase
MAIQFSDIGQQKKVEGLDFPLVITPPGNSIQNDVGAFKLWVSESSDALKALMIKHGAVLFRGFPVSSAELFEEMLDEAEFKNMPYIGGAAPRKQVTSSRILTANESPATEKIPFHHEMAQVPSPPGYIFFYCVTASETGGATSILHSGEIYRALLEISPAFAEKIEKQGVRYVRIMPFETDEVSPIGRSWKETFQCQTREEAEKVMAAAGMSWEWLDNGSVRTETATLQAVRFDKETQQKVFFNAIVAVFSGWNDSRNIAELAVLTGDGEYMDGDVIRQLMVEMEKRSINFPWEPGDVLWVNNYTVLHARQSFTGERRILASIAMK